MCGISCIIDTSSSSAPEVLEDFTNAMKHRGPDGFGFARFADNEALRELESGNFFLGLGHRRLSILDLSEAGAQPMFSDDRDYVISFNGEVYNYIELREELKAAGSVFRSGTDTEVILEAYRQWGSDCVKKFNGMWAFVILDRKKRSLFISRDRIGIKPLYYYHKDGLLALGSEIKQFFKLPGIHSGVNARACLIYLETGYEIPPETFFEDIYAFPPASYAEIDLSNPGIEPVPFWSADDISIDPSRTEEELVEKIRETFNSAVKLRLRSDVPVGGCLSGGLDSSAIFTEMKELNPESTFSAFSACFDIPSIDERPFMKSVVDKTGSKHITVSPSEDDITGDILTLLEQHDEPIGSISMYAQYRVMKTARENGVPVLLDGQGGDELFSGYWPSYFLMLNGKLKKNKFIQLFRHLAGALLPKGNCGLIMQALSHFNDYRNRAQRKLPFEVKREYRKVIDSLSTSTWFKEAQQLSPEEYRKAEILKIHLPRLLKWEDRNSMAFSIESRVPFLDINLIELLLSASPEMNMKRGWTKYLFRKAMSERLPADICWRKDKMGFETPQDKWMKEGFLHKFLLEWCDWENHPVSDFISTDFSNIRETLKSGEFNSTAMFRLFCLDYWLKNIAGKI